MPDPRTDRIDGKTIRDAKRVGAVARSGNAVFRLGSLECPEIDVGLVLTDGAGRACLRCATLLRQAAQAGFKMVLLLLVSILNRGLGRWFADGCRPAGIGLCLGLHTVKNG